MNAYELKFYEAGIRDAGEQRKVVSASNSKRYMDLSKELNVQIGDVRGNSSKAYCSGVMFEMERQARLVLGK